MSPKQFRDIREKLELTQKELAQTLGVTEMAISHYETGFRRPGPTIGVLLRVLNSLSKKQAHELVTLLQSHATARKPMRSVKR